MDLLIENLPRHLYATCFELVRLADEDGLIAPDECLTKLLASRCLYDIRTAERHLTKLKELGWIQPEWQLAPNGRCLPTRYQILGNEKKTAA
ncbi:hypothetical protein [Gallaecimonas pentaromativorans]|uniref:hypothetical protein n=1 Tax=Gallaecimonas pentaromativorans TaxID=584787 RepID=UPI00067F6556|nr:hypothetical protein [Gallaecimonas pentaromativorans]